LQLGPAHEPHRDGTRSVKKVFRGIRVVETAPDRATFDLQFAGERARREVQEVEQIEVCRYACRRAIEDHGGPFFGVRQEAWRDVGVERRVDVLRNVQMNLRLRRSGQGKRGESDSEPCETFSSLHESLLNKSPRRAVESE